MSAATKTFILVVIVGSGILFHQTYVTDSGTNIMNENHTELISVTNGSIEFKKKLLELIRTSVTQNNNSTEIYDESQIVHRNEWHARPPGNPIPPLALPAFRVIIAHTVTPNCLTFDACKYRVLNIQEYHMESRHWDDIGYNFLIGGDGMVYEGRGWDELGAHTYGYNQNSIGIAFIGTFTKIPPSLKQLHAAKWLIEEGVLIKKIDPNYRLYGHRQLIPTISPGDALYKIIQKWPHWSNEIIQQQ